MFYKAFIFSTVFLMIAMAPCAHTALAAEKYTIKEMTPQVTSALESRRDRYSELQQLKQQGKVGENNRGYVEVFANEKVVKSLVDVENSDRKIIYQTIADQNNLKDAIGVIEKVFAQTQRDKAQSGEKIQDEDGRWVTK